MRSTAVLVIVLMGLGACDATLAGPAQDAGPPIESGLRDGPVADLPPLADAPFDGTALDGSVPDGPPTDAPPTDASPADGPSPDAPKDGAAPPCPTGPFSNALNSYPPPCFRPYSPQSPFNKPLPANPKLLTSSTAIVSRMTASPVQELVVGFPSDSSNDYFHPIYYAQSTDPLFTITCTQWVSSCAIHGLQIRIPQQARPAGGTDGHMAVIDQQNGWEYDMWQVQTTPLPAGGGTVLVSHGGKTAWNPASATGLGSNATKAWFGLAAGMIRAEEWDDATSNNTGIKHALFAIVPCTNGQQVYPSTTVGTPYTCSNTTDAPAMGQHIYLAMSDSQINALSVPAWKKPILKALAHYGMFIGDTGGSNISFGLMAESDQQYVSFGQPGKLAALGQKWGAGTWAGGYVFDIDAGVGWASYLRVIDPCVAQGTC